MNTLLTLIPLLIIFFVLYVPFVVRAYARTHGDEVVQGKRTATETVLNRYISVLTWCNNWITHNEELDDLRIKQLRDMLEEMQKPHG
ncbi:hypothetical protein ES705_15947 [subsurface metagenome]